MIYNEVEEYKIVFFVDPNTGKNPVEDYFEGLDKKHRAKIEKFIEYLRINNGVIGEPITRHIRGAIRELRVDFARNRYRVFFFTFVGKQIFLLHAFSKRTQKTPESEINKALVNYYKIFNK